MAAEAEEALALCGEVWLLPPAVADGAAGVAAAALPPAGGLAAAGWGELVPVEEVLDEEGRVPPTPPSMVKGPAKARSGEFPSSKASIW